MKKEIFTSILIFCCTILLINRLEAAAPSRTQTYTAGEVISQSEVTENEDNIFSYLQAGVDTYRTGSVTSASIEDGTITTNDISTDTITASDLAADSVGSSEIVAGAVGTSELSDDSIAATDLSATLTFSDGDLLDLDAINVSSTTEGLLIPQATSCSSGSAEGQICWDTDDNVLYIGTSSAAQAVGNPGTPALTLGTSNSAGTANTVVRTDATLALFDTTVPVTQAFGDSAATGSAAIAARRDHVHGMPSTAWVFVESLTLTSGSSVSSSTLPTTSDIFMMVLDDVSDSGGSGSVRLRFNADTGNNYAYVRRAWATFSSLTAQSGLLLVNSTGTVNGSLIFTRLRGTQSSNVHLYGSLTSPDTGGSNGVLQEGAWSGGADATTFNFSTVSGASFNAGRVHLYRLAQQ